MDRFTDFNRRQSRRAWIAHFDRFCEAFGKAAVILTALWLIWAVCDAIGRVWG